MKDEPASAFRTDLRILLVASKSVSLQRETKICVMTWYQTVTNLISGIDLRVLKPEAVGSREMD